MESAIKDHPLWANATIEDIESAMEVINFKKKKFKIFFSVWLLLLSSVFNEISFNFMYLGTNIYNDPLTYEVIPLPILEVIAYRILNSDQPCLAVRNFQWVAGCMLSKFRSVTNLGRRFLYLLCLNQFLCPQKYCPPRHLGCSP